MKSSGIETAIATINVLSDEVVHFDIHGRYFDEEGCHEHFRILKPLLSSEKVYVIFTMQKPPTKPLKGTTKRLMDNYLNTYLKEALLVVPNPMMRMFATFFIMTSTWGFPHTFFKSFEEAEDYVQEKL